MEMKQLSSNKEGFNKDASLEFKFIWMIKAFLGNYFITKDINADLNAGTDFLVLNLNNFRIAVRLRRYEYYLKYPDDFTIRWERPSGVITEYAKIMTGLVDYIFYGFINQEETEIIKYFIGDLKIFRDKNLKPLEIKINDPYDSTFAVFNVNQFPQEFILDKYNQLVYYATN